MSRPINKSKGDHCTACDGTGLAPKQRQPKSKEPAKGPSREDRQGYGSVKSDLKTTAGRVVKLATEAKSAQAEKNVRAKKVRKGYK